MNYENFARPESTIDHGFEEHDLLAPGPIRDDVMDDGEPQEGGYPCEECGTLCDGDFCSQACYDDAHAGFGGIDDDDHQPTEYEEWQDLYGGDDWDHGQYDDVSYFDE